jgi:hypothetical protein
MVAVLKHSEFDVSELGFEQPVNSQKKKAFQNLYFPTYSGERCPMIQLPSIEIDMYGVPSKSDYFKEDAQRMFIKLPLNQCDSEVEKFTDMLKKIDTKLGNEKYKEKMFGKKTKYKYQPIVRFVPDEEGNPRKDRHPYIKLKLMTSYPDNDILTTVTKKDKDGNKTLMNNTHTLDDFTKYVKYLSKFKCIISIAKLWTGSTSEPSYGVTLKCTKVLVEHQPQSFLVDFLKDEEAFVED